MPSPDRHRSSRGSPISNKPQSNNNCAATTEVKYLGSIPWYHLYPEGMTYTKGRYSLEPCCILPVSTISGVWGSTKSRPQSYAFSKSHALGQQMINLWSQRYKIKQMIISQMIKHWSFHSNTQYATLPNWDISLINFNYITSELVRLREGC